MKRRFFMPVSIALVMGSAVAGCHGRQGAANGDDDHRPFHAIADNEVVHVAGTEPFWHGEVANGRFTYATPDDPKGTVITVSRFAGRGGLSFSGELRGEALIMTVTPGTCSDGMSDRMYPLEIMLRVGADLRHGCGWTAHRPWKGRQ